MGYKTIEEEKSVKWTGCVEWGCSGAWKCDEGGNVGLVKCGGGGRFEEEVGGSWQGARP